MASTIRMQKFEPEKEKAETDFGRPSLSWKAKTSTEQGSVCTNTGAHVFLLRK